MSDCLSWLRAFFMQLSYKPEPDPDGWCYAAVYLETAASETGGGVEK